jgi:hypothetical protein
VKTLYSSLLTVASKFRLSLHLSVPGIRGWIIVGTHHLVVRAAKELKPSLDCYGIVYLRVSPFNPVRKLCEANLHTQTSAVQDVSPGRDDAVLTIDQRLIKVETISRFPHSFLSGWRGLYLHLKEVSGANVVLREKRLTPTSL